jgi:hypothetical protein
LSVLEFTFVHLPEKRSVKRSSEQFLPSVQGAGYTDAHTEVRGVMCFQLFIQIRLKNFTLKNLNEISSNIVSQWLKNQLVTDLAVTMKHQLVVRSVLLREVIFQKGQTGHFARAGNRTRVLRFVRPPLNQLSYASACESIICFFKESLIASAKTFQ